MLYLLFGGNVREVTLMEKRIMALEATYIDFRGRLDLGDKRQDICDAERMALMLWKKEIDKNTKATERNTQMLENIEKLFETLGWLSHAMKWVGVTGASFAPSMLQPRDLKYGRNRTPSQPRTDYPE